MRIFSLLPSATEIVFALGLGDQLVGVSHECDYPPEVRFMTPVTTSDIPEGMSRLAIHEAVEESVHKGFSLYHIKPDLLKELAPDLVLTQEICDV